MSNQKSTESCIKNLEVQVGQLAKQLEDRPSSSFGANIEKNPKEESKAIMTRSKMSNADSDLLVAFKTGAELLYEIRLLSAFQCITVARFLVENRCDGKATQELARAMKDFPSRHGDKGWESFDYTLLEDCLSFMYYRQSREHRNPSKQRTSVLE
ncbi:rubisco accumulation factor 1.2, chloroplastic-like [Glycine max]|uniref:rubisco accumulation factor 1.2, chloroplastic-like n=1 Tax=Glycine max TaxID=3847 RepID=UPI0003DEAD93|nr:rubisco accumulation factor 1.2, chloroplastic-like [Glycine max]|eukprot:XP_025980010.1 rubisco accumulation factor 1.2, chloroplastic-like [Glycine max]